MPRKKVNNGTHLNGARTRVKKEESKAKKEENYDDFEEPIVNRSLNKVKKEQSEDECGEPTVKKSSKKTDKKKKKIKEVEKQNGAKGAKQNVKKREKKVYHLPGQKRDPPEERDPLRIFYESLYRQEPNSEMAAFWMMENGLLPEEEAKKVYEKKLKRNQQQKLASPMKDVVTVKESAESITAKRNIMSSPEPKKKTPESKAALKPSKTCKIEDDDTSDHEVLSDFKMSKKRRAA